jgi:uncharacterized protein YgbK (DUF1537 family)
MNKKLIVLDDDPTGCQTVHDIKIFLQWDPSAIRAALNSENCFYILTNSRAYPENTASKMNYDIAKMLKENIGKADLGIISRSDSTLRGHFHAEIETLNEVLGPYDGILIVPYFVEGGRFTLNDTHYVLQEKTLIEAHKTEFSKDSLFGFSDAHLPAYIEEKTKGKWKKHQVVSVSLEDIRTGGVETVYRKLKTVKNATPVVINAVCDEDLEIVVLALIQAEQERKRFLYRTAASFVKVRAGIEDVALFEPKTRMKKGLIVVGSYVNKSTRQLKYLLDHYSVCDKRLIIDRVLNDHEGTYLDETVMCLESLFQSNPCVVIYTERNYQLSDLSKTEQIEAAKKISLFLTKIIGQLKTRPDFMIAKGGITAFDIARYGLGMREARVMGQISPGIPIWKAGEHSRFPGIPYIVFPGNVGDVDTLCRIVTQLSE